MGGRQHGGGKRSYDTWLPGGNGGQEVLDGQRQSVEPN